MMRAVHLTDSVHPRMGGPAYSISRLCESLREDGVEVDLLTLDVQQAEDIATEFAGFAPAPLLGRIGHSPGMWRWLREAADHRRFDILHSHNLWRMPGIYPFLLQRGASVRHVVSPRGTLTPYSMRTGSPLKRPYWALVQRAALRAATCFHATASSELEDIRRLGFTQPVAVIPNGVDLPKWEVPARGSRIIQYFGRLHPEKGVDVLVDAWSRIARDRPDWSLRIVGLDIDGYRRELEDQVRRLGTPNVTFMDPVFGPEKFALMREAAIGVLPSHTENFGLTVAESLSVGVPAVANHGAPWSALDQHDCGWWTAPGVPPLAETLLTASGVSDSRRAEMGVNGRRYVEDVLLWPSIASRMHDLYDWIMHGGSAPSFVET